MGNRKRFGVVNHEIVSDCVCDVRRAVGRSTQFFFQPVWVTVYGSTPSCN